MMLILCMLIATVYAVPQTHNLPHGDELHTISDGMFFAMDLNNDGSLAKDEVVGTLNSFDTDDDGQVSMSEFLNGLTTTPQSVAQKIFVYFDTDMSGYIPSTDFGSIYDKMDVHNHVYDGMVSQNEFRHFIEKIVHAH